MLLGSWDNYFATPANYYLYNSGRAGDERGFMGPRTSRSSRGTTTTASASTTSAPAWQYTDLLDWAGEHRRVLAP